MVLCINHILKDLMKQYWLFLQQLILRIIVAAAENLPLGSVCIYADL